MITESNYKSEWYLENILKWILMKIQHIKIWWDALKARAYGKFISLNI